MRNTATGVIFIIVGLCFIGLDLFPIYQFNISGDWPTVSGTVSRVSSPGFLHLRRHVTVTYRIASRDYESTQMMPTDLWTLGLTEGKLIPVRYRIDKPESAIIDHPEVLGYVLLACWNSLWILLGAGLLYKPKR